MTSFGDGSAMDAARCTVCKLWREPAEYLGEDAIRESAVVTQIRG